MPIEFSCNQCSKKLRVPDEKAGKKVKCPGCQGILVVPASQMTGVGAKIPSSTGLSAIESPPAPTGTGRSSVMMTGVDNPAMQGSLVAPSPKAKKANEPEPDPFAGDDIQLELDTEPAAGPGKVTPPPPRAQEPEKKSGGGRKPEAADEYGLVDDEPGASVVGPVSGANPVKVVPGAAAAAERKAQDAKKAMTVLDGEQEFDGFSVDVGAAGKKAKEKAKDAEKPKNPEVEIFDKGQTLATVATPETGRGEEAPQGDKKPAPGLMEALKKLPPAALYGGIAGVVGLIAVILYFAVFFGDKPQPTPPRGGGGGTTVTKTGGGGTGATTPSGTEDGKTGEEGKKTEDKTKTDFEAMVATGPEDQEAARLVAEFTSKYESAVAAGNSREWKTLAEWCARSGLTGARREALEHARMRDPDDPEVRRQLGQTIPVGLPGNRTAYTTQEAKAAVDRMGSRVVVGNRSHRELRVRIAGATPAEVVVKLGESRSIPLKKSGPVEIVFSAGGKSTTISPSLLPGEAHWVEFVPNDLLPVLPSSAYRTVEAAVALNARGGLTGAAPRGVGEHRVLEVTPDVKKGEFAVRLAGPFPPEFRDAVARKAAERRPLSTVLKPGKDGGPVHFTVGDTANKTQVVLSRTDQRGVTSGRFVQKGAAMYAADADDLRGYVPSDPASAATPPLVFGPGDRMISGASEIEVFPASHEAVFRAAGMNPDAALFAVDRRRFGPLPAQDSLPNTMELLPLVRHRPAPPWSWEAFSGYCRHAGAAPQMGAAYVAGELGTYTVVRRFDPILLDFVNRIPDVSLAASIARYAKDAEGALAAQAGNPRSWQRPYAVALLSWPGNDRALTAVRALASDYSRYDAAGGSPDPLQRSLFTEWNDAVSLPNLIAGCLTNIGTDKAIETLRQIAEDPKSGTKLSAACIPALSGSGHVKAIPFMVDLVQRYPTFLDLQAQWVGRWDLPETRRLVDGHLKKGAESTGLRYLARALEQQEPGRGNLYIINALARYKPVETELARVTGAGDWRWEPQPLQKGASAKRQVPAVAWLISRRGDPPAAAAILTLLTTNLDALADAMTKGPENDAGFVFPVTRGGAKFNQNRHDRFGTATTLFEEAFANFRGKDAALLVKPLIGLSSINKAVGEKNWRQYWVNILARLHHPGAVPALSAHLAQKGPEDMSARAREDAAAAAQQGLLALGDKESLKALAAQPGRELYRRIGNVTLGFMSQSGGGGAGAKAVEAARTKALVASLTEVDTGLPSKAAEDWNEFVDRNVWGPFRGLFTSVRNPEASHVGPDLYEYHRTVARLAREDEDRKARKRGVGPRPTTGDAPARPANRTVPRPDLDEEQRGYVVKMITQLVWPDDGTNLDIRDATVGVEFAPLRRQALAVLIDLNEPKDLDARMRKSLDFPTLGSMVLEQLAKSGKAADLDLIIERTTKEIVLSPARVAARHSRRSTDYVRVGQTRLNGILAEAMTRKVRPDLASAVPLMVAENYDILDLLEDEPVTEAIRLLGNVGDQKCLDHLLALFDDEKVIGARAGSTTEGGAVVTDLPSTKDLRPGMTVAGPGIPAKSTIASVDSDTRITLSAKAAAAGSVSLTFRAPTVPPANYQTSESCEREIFRRAAALAAVAAIDPRAARDRLIRILTTQDPENYGFKKLSKVDAAVGSSTPDGLARHQLVLLANFRRACMSAAAGIPGVLDQGSIAALGQTAEFRTTEIIGNAGLMQPVDEAERETSRHALRLLLWKGGRAAGPVLARLLEPARAERLGLAADAALTRLLLSVVSERCMSPDLAPTLYQLLADPKAATPLRKWALENLILTGDEKQLELLAVYIAGPDFRRTFEGQFEGGALMAIFQQMRDPASGIAPQTAIRFFLPVMQTVGAQADGVVSAPAAREGLLALASFEHPEALAALKKLRDLPRFKHAASYLLFGRGDLDSIDPLSAGAADAKREDAGKALETLSAMPHVKSLGAILEYAEKSSDRDVRLDAAGALYRMVMGMTAGRQGDAGIPTELTDRILKSIRGVPPDVAHAFRLVLAASGHDPGLEHLAQEALLVPSTGVENERMMLVFDLAVSRIGDRLTPGVKALLDAILLKRRVAQPIGEPLTTSAAELAARSKFFDDKAALEEVLKRPLTRVAALESLVILDKGKLGQEARLHLEAIRDGKAPVAVPKPTPKEVAAEVAEATAALQRGGPAAGGGQ